MSGGIDDSGPAFPSVSTGTTQHGDAVVVVRDYEGMSLRDYFAAKALVGLLASQNEENGVYGSFDAAAQDAYMAADAMLAAREGGAS